MSTTPVLLAAPIACNVGLAAAPTLRMMGPVPFGEMVSGALVVVVVMVGLAAPNAMFPEPLSTTFVSQETAVPDAE